VLTETAYIRVKWSGGRPRPPESAETAAEGGRRSTGND